MSSIFKSVKISEDLFVLKDEALEEIWSKYGKTASGEDSVQSAAKKAEDIVETAYAKAQNILNEAQRKAVDIVKNAGLEGREIKVKAQEEGTDEAHNRVREEYLTSLNSMAEAVRMANENFHKLLENCEPEIIKVAVEIAGKILKKAVELDDKVVLSMIKDAIKHSAQRWTLVVKVNPDDLAMAQFHIDEIMASAEGIKELSIISDARISRGSCLVETPAGEIEAIIEDQLESLGRKLTGTAE